jgi:hypothetical protein
MAGQMQNITSWNSKRKYHKIEEAFLESKEAAITTKNWQRN